MRKRACGAILAVLTVAALYAVACAPQAPAGGPVARGKQVYDVTGCATCHESGLGNLFHPVGPPLDHIGTVAQTRRAGMAAADYLRQSVVDPGSYVVPGYPDSMPRGLGEKLSKEDLDALVMYLSSLR